MRFARPLVRGTLVRRYKRFLADVMLEDGSAVTAHCANPGAMLGLNSPGTRVWLEPVAAPGRKLSHAWRLVELAGGGLVGIDASLPNQLVAEALAARRLPTLAGYAAVRPEVRYGTRSRVDFLLTGPGLPDAYVEVKNVHFSRTEGFAEFPDSVTARGARHLAELSAMVAAVQSVRWTTYSITARCPAATMAESSARCRAPRAVTLSGNSASPSARLK